MIKRNIPLDTNEIYWFSSRTSAFDSIYAGSVDVAIPRANKSVPPRNPLTTMLVLEKSVIRTRNSYPTRLRRAVARPPLTH